MPLAYTVWPQPPNEALSIDRPTVGVRGARRTHPNHAGLVDEEVPVAGTARRRRIGGAAPGFLTGAIRVGITRSRSRTEHGVDVVLGLEIRQAGRVGLKAGTVLLVHGRECPEAAHGNRASGGSRDEHPAEDENVDDRRQDAARRSGESPSFPGQLSNLPACPPEAADTEEEPVAREHERNYRRDDERYGRTTY